MANRFAIISDLHSNTEAVGAVLAHIDERKIKTIYCLGDVVGYGPEPEAVCDVVRKRCAFTIRGNHDDALFNDAKRFNALARDAIKYTRERLRPGFLRGRECNDRWDWLRNLPLYQRKGSFLFVHGSPTDPVNEYVYQEDVFFNADGKLKPIFEATEQATFCGHTHLPVIIGSDLKTWTPKDDASEFKLQPGVKYIVNVGSVGQPRDRDSRSCYVEVDGDVVRYHRVPYDIESVQRKILAIPALHELLARRLAEGI
ncbi:MAG TPA: metallophosphoesterase family protein [Planctomycetota bacterium]|nr:metallophosphoesterase family protein [Planctomycetota bacterium]